jgi:hypothetical protein
MKPTPSLVTVALILLAVVLGCNSASDNSQVAANVAPTPTATPTCGLSGPECDYLAAAEKYIKSIQDIDSGAAEAIKKKDSAGTQWFKDVAEAIKKARSAEGQSYEEAYSKVAVAPGHEALDKQLKAVHTQHVDAFNEFAAYTDDGNLTHIIKGSEKFKKAMQTANKAVGDFNKKVESINIL